MMASPSKDSKFSICLFFAAVNIDVEGQQHTPELRENNSA